MSDGWPACLKVEWPWTSERQHALQAAALAQAEGADAEVVLAALLHGNR